MSSTGTNSGLTEKGSANAVVISAIDLIAGSLGGCANVLVGQPLDTVKVKLQTFPHLYQGAFNCFKQTFIKDGIRKGLYAGTVPALVANVAENSVLFCAYGFCQKVVAGVSKSDSQGPLGKAFAGSLAAFFASFTLCPTELIKCKLQALRETGATQVGAYNITRSILKLEGIPGLYRGLTPTLAREMPGYFFFFGGYEVTKTFLSKLLVGSPSSETGDLDEDVSWHDSLMYHSHSQALFTTVIAGGVGGVCLWTAIFPFDVAKSRMQVSTQKSSMFKVIIQVFQESGVRGLYKGLLPTVLRTFPATGALFVAYEYSKTFMTSFV